MSTYTKDGSVTINKRPVLRSKTGGWKACSFLAVYEVCERTAFFAILSNMIIYMTNNLQQGTTISYKNVNIWDGVTFIVPLFGALVADTHLGRFWTFTIFSTIYILGMTLLTMSALIPSLKTHPCNTGEHCEKPSGIQVGVFYLAIYITAVGAGGATPNISTIGADQFDEFDEKEKLQKASFFNWWMICTYSGTLIGQTFMIYIQDNYGFGWGYGIPAIIFILGVTGFYSGTPSYRHKVQHTNAFLQLARVLIASVRKWDAGLPSHPTQLHEVENHVNVSMGKYPIAHTPILRFLDRAAVKTDSSKTPWNLCTITDVEETKMMVKLLPIWLCLLIPFLIISQAPTLFVKQATKLDRKLGDGGFEIPAGSLIAFKTMSLLLTVLLYERLLIKLFKRFAHHKRGFSSLQRSFIGLVFVTMSMVAAPIADAKRMQLVRKESLSNNSKAVAPMSVMVLAPQFILLGIAGGFMFPAILEFFYEEAPQSMKSTGTALMFVDAGLGSVLSSILLTVVDTLTRRIHGQHGWISNNLNSSNLYYYYVFLASLCFFNSILFVVLSRKYAYKKPIESVASPL